MLKERVVKEEKFEVKGTVISGRLLSANRVKYQDGGSNIEYLIRSAANGHPTIVRGTSDINRKLFRGDVGCLIEITYVGTDESTAVDGRNAKKIFRVSVDEETKPVRTGDGTEITDDDIPF